MFHWTDKRIEGHICLCYIAFALQNYVLQKANKTKSVFTETSLRKTLDKMQVSLMKHHTQEIYYVPHPRKRSVFTTTDGCAATAAYHCN